MEPNTPAHPHPHPHPQVEYPQHPEVYDSRQTLSRTPTLDSMGRPRDTLGKHDEKALPAGPLSNPGPTGPPAAGGGPPPPPGVKKYAHGCE